jgi:3-deoxy-D-manno-octulosonic-acid transferase
VNRSQTNFGLGTRILLALYSIAAAGALLLTAPFWIRELRDDGKYREGLRERLGSVPARLQVPATGQIVLWLHAVSVGEVLAAAPLVHALRKAMPGARIFISTTTRTGQAIARTRFSADSVFYFPADFAFAVRAWLRFLKPSAIILVESEFWPRFLVEASRAGVRVAVVNARISGRSWPRYWRLAGLWRPLLRSLAFVQAQSDDDADCLRYLGAGPVSTGGNLKYDLSPLRSSTLVPLLKAHLPQGTPVFVCGSTLEEEEYVLLGSLSRNSIVLFAPRHPERFEAVADMLAKQPRPWLRLSAWRLRPETIAPGSILLLDSIGELSAVYALATVAIVGGGFLHAGGHNPLEPAAMAKPIVIGPNAQNFVDIVVKLYEARAILITDSPNVAPEVEYLVQHPEEARAMGERARQVCLQQSGATERALAAILQLVRR